MFQHPPPSLTPLGPLIMNVSLWRSTGIGQISPTSKWTERWKKEIDQYIYRINVSWHDFISWLVPIFAWKALFSHPVMPSAQLNSRCLYNCSWKFYLLVYMCTTVHWIQLQILMAIILSFNSLKIYPCTGVYIFQPLIKHPLILHVYKDLLSSIFLIRFLIEQLTYRNKICFWQN